MSKYHFVYVTTNLINSKRYVGDHSTNNLNDNYLGSGRPAFDSAKKKYGKKNFKLKILEFFPTKEEAFDAQKKYIKEFNTLVPNGYNISPTGGIGVAGCFTEETFEKITKTKRQRGTNKAWNKGKKLSKESRDKMSQAKKGKTLSEEHKNNIKKSCRNINKGKIVSEETKRKISETSKGKKLSEEHKLKIQLKAKEGMTLDRRNKISESGMGRIPWNKGKKIKK